MKGQPLLLDTNCWIWLDDGNSRLKKPHQDLISHAAINNQLYLSAISLWEFCMLEEKKRITIQRPAEEWIKESIKLAKVHIIPLSPEVAAESCRLPGNFHGDPADRIIVASAKVHGLTLLTSDKKILTYSKKAHLKTIRV